MKLFAATVSQKAGAIFVLLALVSGGFYYVNVHQDKAYEKCSADYNTAFTETQRLRSEFSAARQDAADAVISGVGKVILSPPETRADEKKVAAEYMRLFRDFDKASKANEAARAANPLPALPDC